MTGGGLGVTEQPTAEVKICERCGSTDGQHSWIEGDCVLRHRQHSMKLVDGTNVCQWCVERWREWLSEVLDLYATLDEVLEPGSIPDDTADHKRPKKAADVPALVRLEAFALLLDRHRLAPAVQLEDRTYAAPGYLTSALPDVPAVLTAWAQNACDDRGLAGASLDSTLSTAVKLLDEHAEFIAGCPWVDEYDAELRWVRTSLKRAHGIVNPKPLGQCLTVTADKACTGHVWADQDGGQPRCDRCNRRYGTLDLVRVRIMAKETA